MRKYTPDALLKMPWSPAHAKVESLKPFGGKYPTRILWLVQYEKKPSEAYFGKPSSATLMRFLRLFRLRDWQDFLFIEFDKANLVAEATPKLLVQGDRWLRARTGGAFAYYHPYEHAYSYLSTWTKHLFPQSAGAGQKHRYRIMKMAPHKYSAYICDYVLVDPAYQNVLDAARLQVGLAPAQPAAVQQGRNKIAAAGVDVGV